MTPPFTLSCRSDSADVLHLDAQLLSQRGERATWDVICTAGTEDFHGTIRLDFALPPQATTPWFFAPGFFLAEGRSEANLAYPRLGTPTHADDRWCSPHWDFALDRCSHPVLLAECADRRWRGLSWVPHASFPADGADSDAPSHWGDSEPQIGLGLWWDADHGRGGLALNLPANEGPRRHARSPRDAATSRRLRLRAGTTLRFTVSTWDLAPDTRAPARVLATVASDLRHEHPRAEVPDSDTALAATAAHGICAWHWVPEQRSDTGVLPGYFVYTAAMDRSVEYNANVNRGTSLGWHFEALGFVGGFPVAYALWWQALCGGASPEAATCHDIAAACVTRWCRDGHAANGLFRTSYHPGRARTRHGSFANGSDTPGYGSCWQGDPDLLHARTTADASLHLARLLDLLGPAHPQYGTWRASLRRSLDAMLALQREDGRHPQRYRADTLAAAGYDGDAGLLWIPACHHAHGCFADDPAFQARLLDSMQRAGDAYAAAVARGLIVGAPEDVGLAPTSEDAYNAVLAYTALHERTLTQHGAAHEATKRWLDLLIAAADTTLAWRKAYNVRFDRRSVLGSADFRTVGGDFASAHNNHLHVYGMNCLAALYRLAVISDQHHYADRADDHFAFCSQLLCTVDGRWNGQRGMMTEQFYTSDWSIWGTWDPGPAHVQKGTFMGFSHVWCIAMVILGVIDRDHAKRAGWRR